MKILVINSGSSSIKFKIFDMDKNQNIATGIIEEISTRNACATLIDKRSGNVFTDKEGIENHEKGISVVNRLLKESGLVKDMSELGGIGHRVVQGGDIYDRSVLIDNKVIADIDALSILAPLHNPGHLSGIKSVMKQAPLVPNVAVFDTVFHQSIPEYAYRYAIPNEFYDKFNIRRYGAHGTSHHFAFHEACAHLQKNPQEFNAITLHIGNGASASAIKGGECIDTSMGLTPLEGLMMGTRCGDIDPSVIKFISEKSDKSLSEIDMIFNKKSGLLGICGESDVREVQRQMRLGNSAARLAFDMYIYRIVKYVGAYFAVLPRTDAIIFTAGVGENSNIVRERICEAIEHLGAKIDDIKNWKNRHDTRVISKEDSKIKILVVPANEELAIANETLRVIKGL